MKLPKDFPRFQTVAWWIKQLKEYPKDAIVMVATGPGERPGALLSTYHPKARGSKWYEYDKDDKAFLWIDVGH